VDWVVGTLTEYGLWGDSASLSREQQRRYVRDAKFSGILAEVLDAPQLRTKLSALLSDLRTQSGHHAQILTICVFVALKHPVSLSTLVDIWGDGVLRGGFAHDPTVKQLVSFDGGTIRLRSALVAEYILRSVADARKVVDTLIHIVVRADELRRVDAKWDDLKRDLTRFGNLNKLLPAQQKLPSALKFYEGIRRLGSNTRYPLFWLQYAIACFVLDDLERAGTYFDTAYALSRGIDFDTFQIDNHYSRYLLVASIRSDDAATCMPEFRKARAIIQRQIHERVHWTYPYNAATAFLDFYLTFRERLDASSIREIVAASEYMLRRAQQWSERRNRAVVDCADAMRQILQSEKGADSTV